MIRLSITIVFIWIGLLKFILYGADSITSSVANSPVMSLFYEYPEGYKQHLIHEGEFEPQACKWQTTNNTCTSSSGPGVVEVLIALLMLANPVSRWLGLADGVLTFTTPIIILLFLITTPEAWVIPLGDLHHGFPCLSGAGRLVLKDTLMLVGVVVTTTDSSRSMIKQRY